MLAGFLLIDAGFEQGDTVAALVVACVIFAAAARLIFENASVLMDRAPADAHDRAQEAIDALGSDIELRRLRLRESAGRYFADAVIAVPPGRAVVEGHDGGITWSRRCARRCRAATSSCTSSRAAAGWTCAIACSPPRSASRSSARRTTSPSTSTAGAQRLAPPQAPRRRSALDEAHDAAERIEAAIRRERGVVDVQTHLEPMEHPRRA